MQNIILTSFLEADCPYSFPTERLLLGGEFVLVGDKRRGGRSRGTQNLRPPRMSPSTVMGSTPDEEALQDVAQTQHSHHALTGIFQPSIVHNIGVTLTAHHA